MYTKCIQLTPHILFIYFVVEAQLAYYGQLVENLPDELFVDVCLSVRYKLRTIVVPGSWLL